MHLQGHRHKNISPYQTRDRCPEDEVLFKFPLIFKFKKYKMFRRT